MDETTKRREDEERPETIGEIVETMRGVAGIVERNIASQPGANTIARTRKIERGLRADELRMFADRIEAAAKNGNMAKMRAALVWAKRYAEQIERKTGEADVADDAGEIAEECSMALAAPPRNCDRFTNAMEAEAEFGRTCRPKNASVVYPGPSREQFIEWLFATAEPEKGAKKE